MGDTRAPLDRITQVDEAVVAWARTSKKQLVPLCPFAKSVFEKRPDLRDVLAP